MKKLSKKTKNILFAVCLIFVAAFTCFIADCIYKSGVTAGERQGYSKGYQKGLIEAKSEAVTEDKDTLDIDELLRELSSEKSQQHEEHRSQNELIRNQYTTTASETVKAVEFVYITEKGKKYHKSGCQYLRITAIEIDKAEAIGEGYTPCSRCYPDGDE